MRLGVVGMMPADFRDIDASHLAAIAELNLTGAAMHSPIASLGDVTTAECADVRATIEAASGAATVPQVLTGETKLSATGQTFVASTHFPAVRDTVMGRCAMCHAVVPGYEGIPYPPKNVVLDTAIAEHAREIYLQAGRSHAMPPGNVSGITDEERQLIVTWFEEAR